MRLVLKSIRLFNFKSYLGEVEIFPHQVKYPLTLRTSPSW